MWIYMYIYIYIWIYRNIYIYIYIYMFIYVHIYIYKCAQVHELQQSHCGDKREGTLFSWFHIYITSILLLWDLREIWALYLYIYIYIYIYILLLLLTGFGGHANFFFISTQNIILIFKSFFHSRVLKICTYTIQRTVMKAV